MTARWREVTAGEVAAAIRGEMVSGAPDIVFSGISTDSRTLGPGQVFLALKGERFDGHDHVDEALRKGAAGLVLERGRLAEVPAGGGGAVMAVADTLRALGDLAHWWRRRHAVTVAAITGSAGKTTTKEMTAAILTLGARTLKNSGNFNNLIGLPLTLLGLEKDHGRAVLEMGMNRPGEIGRLTEIADPDIGLITNVARVHIEGLGDLRGVARAKVEMLERLSGRARAVLNGDDALLMETASLLGRETVTFGMGAENDVLCRSMRNLGRDGFAFEVRYRGALIPIRLRVQGLHNVFNALAAAAIALCLGEPAERIVEGLGRFEGVKGRFALLEIPGGGTLVDDTYNANPTALKMALDSVKALAGGDARILLGLGEMMELGAESVTAHLEAGGMAAATGAACLVAMGPHAPEMVQGALEAGMPRELVSVAESHAEMAERLRREVRAGDLVLLKGSRKMALEKVVECLRQESQEGMQNG